MEFLFVGFPVAAVNLSYKDPYEIIFSYVAAFVGIFVPYGIPSLILFLVGPMSWVSLVVFLTAMFIANKKIKKLEFSTTKKVAIIF